MSATQIATTLSSLHLLVTFDPQEIGRRMAAARNKKGWTQLDFAIKAHVSPSSVSRWERGFLPPVRELVRLAGVLEIDPGDLVEEPAETERDAAILAKLGEIERLLRALSPVTQNGERRRKH